MASIQLFIFYMPPIDKPKLLLIAGSGRNSGKTSLACRVIWQMKDIVPIVAFKISPHRHKLLPGGRVLVDESTVYLAEETDPGNPKDSSRMLAAGARRSFFAMASDKELPLVMNMIFTEAGRDAFLIGESAGLRQYFRPGLFIFVNHADPLQRKSDYHSVQDFADAVITFDGAHFNVDLNRIGVTQNSWEFKS